MHSGQWTILQTKNYEISWIDVYLVYMYLGNSSKNLSSSSIPTVYKEVTSLDNYKINVNRKGETQARCNWHPAPLLAIIGTDNEKFPKSSEGGQTELYKKVEVFGMMKCLSIQLYNVHHYL